MAANRCPNPNCEYFNRTLPNNAKVCPMCGTGLGPVSVVVPAPAPPSPPTPVTQPPAQPVLGLLHTSGREFRLPGAEGYIGRRSQASSTVPEIDLTGIPNEGIVSRSHARIYWDLSQNAYMIVDNSRNGTYLNGNPLTPNIQYRLNHGDSLQLGQNSLVCFTVSVM